MKKIKALFVCIVMLTTIFIGNVSAASNNVSVVLDGTELSFDVAPQIINGRTMVPMRKIFEEMGATVRWFDETQTVRAVQSICFVQATINDNVMTVNGTPKILDVPPMLKDGRTLVPVRFIAEAFGAKVEWQSESATVYITSQIDYNSAPKWDTYIENYSDISSERGYQTMFTVENLMMKVPNSLVNDYKKICWYTEPMQVMYSSDGRTVVIPKTQKEDYKKLGWCANKNEIDLQGNQNKVNSLVYSSAETGSLTGTITYQYNKYVGTRADVGAEVMLIQTNHIPLERDLFNVFSDNMNDPMIHCTKVDGVGNYYLDNIPVGEYYLLIKSKATYEASKIAALNCSMIEIYLKGKITDDGLEFIKSAANLYSFLVEKIEIKPNQTERYSEDWGYSY